MILCVAFAAVAPFAPLAFGLVTGEAQGFAETKLAIPTDGSRLALRDMDGDGVSELVWIHPKGVGVRFLRADGRFPETNDADLPWPGADLAWDLADIDGDGAIEVVMLEESKRVRTWKLEREQGFDSGRVVIDEVEGRLPRGRRFMRFARDIDGDGRTDLVVPGAERYLVFVAPREGAWPKPLEVSFEASIGFDTGNPERLDARFGMDVSIPWFSIEDVDGDGRDDLVSETDAFVHFHLASPGLPSEPTWALDKLALSESRGKKAELDFDDLFASIEGRVDWRIADLDGVAPNDLLVQQGSTFKVYLGGSRTGNARAPDDLLKSSGHVLTFLLHDLDGDRLPELLMIRAEKVSLGRVVRWLVIPGSLDFDVFAYKNERTGFGKRPMSRVALSLKIPRLLSFMEELEGMSDEFEARLEMPTTVGVFDADGLSNDVVDLRGDQLVVFADCAPAERGRDWRDLDALDFDEVVEQFLLDELEGLEDGQVRDIDLRDIQKLDLSPADALRAACAGREPRFTHALAVTPEGAALQVVDVDGDGISDVVLIEESTQEGMRRIQILVTR